MASSKFIVLKQTCSIILCWWYIDNRKLFFYISNKDPCTKKACNKQNRNKTSEIMPLFFLEWCQKSIARIEIAKPQSTRWSGDNEVAIPHRQNEQRLIHL